MWSWLHTCKFSFARAKLTDLDDEHKNICTKHYVYTDGGHFVRWLYIQITLLELWKVGRILLKCILQTLGTAIAQTGYRLDKWTIRGRLPIRERFFYQSAQTGSEVHPASYSMGTTGFFSGSKAAIARSWPLTSTVPCLDGVVFT
jgi:hypothetical protein